MTDDIEEKERLVRAISQCKASGPSVVDRRETGGLMWVEGAALGLNLQQGNCISPTPQAQQKFEEA